MRLILKLSLKQRIVRQFAEGESITSMHVPILDAETPMDQYDDILEQVLRDYINGKFKLPAKGIKR